MSKLPRIAISGKMRSGKTSLATALSTRLGVPVDSFAAPLKEAGRVLGFGDGEVVKSRAFLQGMNEVIAPLDPWRFPALLEERQYPLTHRGLIIADLRRPEEYIWAKASGFVLVRLDIGHATQLQRGAEPSRLEHVTETALDGAPAAAWDVWLPEFTSVADRVHMIVGLLRLRGYLTGEEQTGG